MSMYFSCRFGIGTGRIWLDDVNCQGSEARLTSCSNRGIEQHDCGHSEDVAIYCTGNAIQYLYVPIVVPTNINYF